MENPVDQLNLLVSKGYKIEDHHFNWRRDALVEANIALINDEGHREFVKALDDEAFRLEKRVLEILHNSIA
jgi:hypothetical protein